MTARFVSNEHTSNCCSASAAACASARICLVLDTVILAVSIFVSILNLLVWIT